MMTIVRDGLLLVVAIALLRVPLSVGNHQSSQQQSLVGSTCLPPPGYLALSCRTLRLVSTTSERLPVDTDGVNACEVTRTYLVQVYAYKYKQQCGWSYNSYIRYYQWSCRLECVPSTDCSETTRLDMRTQRQCCEGFVPKPVEYNQFNPFHIYYIPEDTQPSGCPLARADTLLKCIEIHGLTRFIELIEQSGLEHLINSTDSKVTVFAPINEALEGFNFDSNEAVVHFVRSHIVDREISEMALYHSSQLDTLAGDVTLYVTLVEHYFYRPLLWTPPSKYKKGHHNSYLYSYQHYQHNQGNYVLLNTDRFISGAKVTVADACVTENGDLHIIDAIVPVTNNSLIDIIASRPDLSIFNMALDTLNLKTFLMASMYPHTIFAPSNTAFIDFPMELITCLSQFDREPLNDLILFHISRNVEYLSSLSERNWLFTRLLIHMQLSVDDHGTVLLGDGKVPIAIPNIPASDGVIHIVNDLIFPRMFNYGDCVDFIGSGMMEMYDE